MEIERENINHFLFSFKGRINRKPYLFVLVLLDLFNIFFDLKFGKNVGEILFTLTCGWSIMAIQAKRLHDINKSASLSVLGIIPVLNFFLTTFLSMKKGDKGPNKFGEDPLSEPQDRVDPISEIVKAIIEEKTAKKVEEWESDDLVGEYINNILGNNRFSSSIKNKEVKIEENYEISLIIYFANKDELIRPIQEISLKNGKKYTQKKHELVMKKEYAEEIFLCANNVIGEFFERLNKLNKIRIKVFVPDNKFILDVQVDKKQYSEIKNNSQNNTLDKLKKYNLSYDYDDKAYDFNEIKP
jgi:uncharacterized membrane protein YhaH (DUF805 family)